ncbi:hypothetical protein [Robertkochia solimangrovi]|uniref:hypothetical protein n=1 Tax=Robertkochia solimangrovi TaxID=2213046 RepID=UPI00117CA984|nr:hypothetical protein [Robertkochia solimangrovi]TRZ42810.1 hypothetical protein DMZ48_12125 [Robertkochia solimangrovi]
MGQDIRDLLKNDRSPDSAKMPQGHRDDFARLLKERLPENRKKPSFGFLKMAAAIAIVAAIGVFVFYMGQSSGVETSGSQVVETGGEKEIREKQITLSDISPDLGKIENYYLANINLELADLDMTAENEKLMNSYMSRLAELNKDYQSLLKELNTIGPNENTVNALIDNLQMRLQLLYRLKDKLKELKQDKDETFNVQKT